MKMRGGALPWVLLLLTVLAVLFMFLVVDAPEEKPAHSDAEGHSSRSETPSAALVYKN
ncbi:MAG: hypothetical protein O7H39_11025 [Gammaproteobacteria bacterium]|nr:hypothetical protein [Gammaproteobacteria bacterium]